MSHEETARVAVEAAIKYHRNSKQENSEVEERRKFTLVFCDIVCVFGNCQCLLLLV